MGLNEPSAGMRLCNLIYLVGLESYLLAEIFSARLDLRWMRADNRIQKQNILQSRVLSRVKSIVKSSQMKCIKVIMEDNADSLWNSGKQL